MSQRILRSFIYYLLIMIILVGCDCTEEQMESFVIIPEGPADEAVVDQNPLFTWTENQSCIPEKFQIDISYDAPLYKGGSSRYPTGDSNEFTWPDALSIGGRYTWSMKAYKGPNDVNGPNTESRDFYVGPLCSGEIMTAPHLYYPEKKSWISESGPRKFSWAYTGENCLPPFYEYEFASDPGFANLVDSGMTSDHTQYIYKEFPNCSTLFWRVRAHDGSSPGPWSDIFDFNWVTDDTCWQIHYQSDESGRIAVRLYEDVCSQTGLQTPLSVKLMPGCEVPEGGFLVSGDGRNTSLDHWMGSYSVSLGGGPCPSTGQQYKHLKLNNYYIYVLTPGTYCVSISRNQVVNNQGTDISLLKGTWTDPRTYDIVAMKTVVLDSGFQDAEVQFGWDKIEKIFLNFPLENVHKCYFGPETHCPTVAFTEVGSLIPIFARDSNSEWKLTEVNGMPCYILLENFLIDEYLTEFDELGPRVRDLEIYLRPAPCPAPEQEPAREPSGRVNCAAIKNETKCLNTPGCDWSFVGAGKCIKK